MYYTATTAGVLVPAFSQAAAPCAPSPLAVAGGSATSTVCNMATAEADWLARSTGTGIVWAHDFRSDAEVNNFRWTGGFGSGNDPNGVGHATAGDCRRITTDGIGSSGCLEIVRRAGTGECQASWWRPFVPVTAPGNGKTTNDPGANGTIAPLSYNPTSGGSQIVSISRGYYGHSSYASSSFDGTEFYLQMRVKMDPNRLLNSPDVGKLLYLSTTYRSLTSQEIVTYSRGNGGNQGSRNYFRMYGGWQVFYPMDQEVSPSDGIQPGNESPQDWYYSGGWDTLMYHLVMGRKGVDESLIEVYAAHPGETSYTKIWAQTFAFSDFEWNNGINALIASTYNNGNNMSTQFYHRYTQFILSKSFIPCPTV